MEEDVTLVVLVRLVVAWVLMILVGAFRKVTPVDIDRLLIFSGAGVVAVVVVVDPSMVFTFFSSLTSEGKNFYFVQQFFLCGCLQRSGFRSLH